MRTRFILLALSISAAAITGFLLGSSGKSAPDCCEKNTVCPKMVKPSGTPAAAESRDGAFDRLTAFTIH